MNGLLLCSGPKKIVIISKSKVHILFQTHTYKIFKATDGGHQMKKGTLGGKGNRGAVRGAPPPQQGMRGLGHWNTRYGPRCLPEGTPGCHHVIELSSEAGRVNSIAPATRNSLHISHVKQASKLKWSSLPGRQL